MERFDEISINAISKKDLLLILKALEYTFENTKIDEFSDLKNNIVKELCFLADTNEEQFLEFLQR